MQLRILKQKQELQQIQYLHFKGKFLILYVSSSSVTLMIIIPVIDTLLKIYSIYVVTLEFTPSYCRGYQQMGHTLDNLKIQP